MDEFVITVGSDAEFLISLETTNGLSFVDTVAINAYFCDRRQQSSQIGIKQALTDVSPSNWSAGIVNCVLPAAFTSELDPGKYFLRLDVTTSTGKVKKLLNTQSVFQVYAVD